MNFKRVVQSLLTSTLVRRPLLGGRVIADALNQVGRVTSVEIEMTKDCPLGKKGSTVRMALDAIITPLVVKNGAWEAGVWGVCADYLKKAGSHDVIDLGANCGLFTRQLFVSGAPIRAAFCVEADQGNSEFLKNNLREFAPVTVYNVGLGDHDGSARFYLDKVNHGNYSFAKASVEDSSQFIDIPMAETTGFFEALEPKLGDRILIKCDVQGFDELVLTRIPESVWAKVQFVIVEITQIDKPNFDRDRFATMMQGFDIEDHGTGKSMSVDELLAFSAGRSGGFSDIVLRRKPR